MTFRQGSGCEKRFILRGIGETFTVNASDSLSTHTQRLHPLTQERQQQHCRVGFYGCGKQQSYALVSSEYMTEIPRGNVCLQFSATLASPSMVSLHPRVTLSVSALAINLLSAIGRPCLV